MTTETLLSEPNKQADSSSALPITGNAAKEADEISLLDLLIVLAARKRLILGVTAAFAIFAIVLSLLLPNRYAATVSLLPPQQNSSMGAALTSQLSGIGGMAA